MAGSAPIGGGVAPISGGTGGGVAPIGASGSGGTIGSGAVAAAGGVVGPVAGTGGGAPTYAPKFSAIYNEILMSSKYSCDSPCHAFASMKVAADSVTTYGAIIDVEATGTEYKGVMGCAGTGRKLIVPGKPEESLLYLKVAAGMPPCGHRMRIEGPYLDDREIDQIKQWIQMGAKND